MPQIIMADGLHLIFLSTTAVHVTIVSFMSYDNQGRKHDTIGGFDECAKQGGDLFSYTTLCVLFNRLHDTFDNFLGVSNHASIVTNESFYFLQVFFIDFSATLV